jgi:hypothetical protein
MPKHRTNHQPFVFLKAARKKTGRFKSIPTQITSRLHRRARGAAAQRFIQSHLVLQIGEADLHHGLLHGKFRALGVESVELSAAIHINVLVPSMSAANGQHGVAGRGICWPGNTAIELIACDEG